MIGSELGRNDRDAEIDTSARPLAEKVSSHLAIAAVRQYETRRNASGLFYSAWNHVEYALNESETYDKSQYYFETAQDLLGFISNSEDAGEAVRLGALTLDTYLPAFKLRAQGVEVEPADCEAIYRSLGAALQHLRPLSIDEPPQWRMTEVAILCLSARMRQPNLLLYPASPREEQSSRQSLNHDSYFYTGTDKLPVQQKLIPTQKIYDECITVLTLSPMVEKASKVSRLELSESMSERINYLMSLVIEETAGIPIDRNETRFLNFMTEAVASHHAELASQKSSRRAA